MPRKKKEPPLTRGGKAVDPRSVQPPPYGGKRTYKPDPKKK